MIRDVFAEYPYLLSLLGGILIGLSSALLFWSHGRIAGISGIAGGLFAGTTKGDTQWRICFLVGLIGVGALGLSTPEAFRVGVERSSAALVAAGLLVGFGTRMGSGCTSGHGVCGLSRLSVRSLAATLTFIAAGALSVLLVRVYGGQL